MPVTLVHVSVQPGHEDEFIAASKANHEASILEPGNHRFDVLQNESEPTKFVIYEWYETDQDIVDHKETAQYKNWRTAVDDIMAEPRQGVRYKGLCPELIS